MNLRHALCLLALLGGIVQHAHASILRIEGIARSVSAGEELYTETHEFEGKTHRINYHDSNGKLIAKKRLDYGCSGSAPDWQQHDLRNGNSLGGHWDDGSYVLQRGDRSDTVRPRGTLVASSGFDHFVRDHWDILSGGDTVEFEFALPARLRTIGMRIHSTDGLPGETGIARWFRVEPSSGLFRVFAGAILLGYDDNRALRIYRGPSNIGDGKGGGVDVEIRYRPLAPESGVATRAEPPTVGERSAAHANCSSQDA